LKVNDADPNHSAEWEKIKKEFEAKKDTITKISAAELAELKREIEDPNNILAGNLNVVDGSLIYNADIADETPTTPEKVPETPTPEETIDLVEQMGQ
jgi:hypothetical protein